MTIKRVRAVRRYSGSMLLACTALAGLGGAVGGCNLFDRDEARPLTADAFVSQRVEGRADPEPIDRPGQVIVGGVKPPVEDESRASARPPANPRRNGISPAVQQAVRTPGDAAAARTSPRAGAAAARTTTRTRPSAAPGADVRAAPPTTKGSPDPSGQYVIFGTVLARVNDRPIYAHKVLALLDNALRAEAQRYDARQFRAVAAELIKKEVQNQVREEIVFTAAQKALDPREQEWAENLTLDWQKREQTKAGGSLELARRKWEDEGWDFNERVDHQYRAMMTQVYLQRRMYPLVNVSASDIRRYYEANKDTPEFTRPAEARFRVIKIDPRALKLQGGPAEARQLAESIRVKATAAGADANFEALARGEHNDPTLRSTGGLVPGSEDGFHPKGTYVVESVENAVWSLEPGQVTDVIEHRGAFYVAKLEDKRDAVRKDFEDLAVQKSIRDKLEGIQLMELQRQAQDELRKDAVVQENPQMLEIALDMAMQRYPQWAAGK